MLPEYYEFCNSVKILSGKLALDHIPYELKNLGAKKPLVLTTNSHIKHGNLDIALQGLRDEGVEIGDIFTNIPPNSSVDTVNEIADIYKNKGCDSIIALGGGSVLDTAKGAVIVISQHDSDLLHLMGYEMITRGKHIPYIAIPTTSGTGSEATDVAVITNTKKNVKMEFVSYNLLPDVAVLDPRMTMTLPAKMTASTGMDALCHAIEGYTDAAKNPLSDAYSFAAVKIIGENLLGAVKDGKNADLRLAMANASLLAGASFSNSMVGIVHAIGHACGGIAHVAHGEAMAILLPYGMEYNMDVVGSLYGELLLPFAGADVYAKTPADQRGKTMLKLVRNFEANLAKESGLPTKLSEVGVQKEQLQEIAKGALNDGAIVYNPKDTNYDVVLEILNKAY